MRSAAARFLREAVRSPWSALTKPLHFQSILIIQPIDLLPDGRMNMCDGCPDITVWQGRLARSCPLDEQQRYGQHLRAEPAKPATYP